MAARGKALELRDIAMSKRDQALAKKSQSLELKDIAMFEREGVVNHLEELQAKFHKLGRKLIRHKARALRLSFQLSQVLWLRDSAFSMGLNWGFENFKTLALIAPWYGISFETVSVKFLRIPTVALESLGHLGVERFPDITDWSPNASHPAVLGDADTLENVDGNRGISRGPEDERPPEQVRNPEEGQNS